MCPTLFKLTMESFGYRFGAKARFIGQLAMEQETADNPKLAFHYFNLLFELFFEYLWYAGQYLEKHIDFEGPVYEFVIGSESCVSYMETMARLMSNQLETLE